VVLCQPELADSDITNAQDLAGKMAVMRRLDMRAAGYKSFQEGAERVIRAGAVGLVIVNNEDALFKAGPNDGYVAEIPVMMIMAKDEAALMAAGTSSCLHNFYPRRLHNRYFTVTGQILFLILLF
jgi:hypothetical protein